MRRTDLHAALRHRVDELGIPVLQRTVHEVEQTDSDVTAAGLRTPSASRHRPLLAASQAGAPRIRPRPGPAAVQLSLAAHVKSSFYTATRHAHVRIFRTSRRTHLRN